MTDSSQICSLGFYRQKGRSIGTTRRFPHANSQFQLMTSMSDISHLGLARKTASFWKVCRIRGTQTTIMSDLDKNKSYAFSCLQHRQVVYLFFFRFIRHFADAVFGGASVTEFSRTLERSVSQGSRCLSGPLKADWSVRDDTAWRQADTTSLLDSCF